MPPSPHHGVIRRPNKDALFSLIPETPKAGNVVDAEDNEHLVSLSWDGNVRSFDIGFHINSQYSTNTLVTFGRDNCDISLKPASISKLQCSFEIDDLDTGLVMFYDRSHGHSTQISGEDIASFEKGRSPRKVLVYPRNDGVISMGGSKGDLIQFRLEWLVDENDIKPIARKRRDANKGLVTNPRKARTRDLNDTVLPSVQITPDQAFRQPSQLKLRYLKRNLVGLGSFGKVWRAIDHDSGRVMAMKQIDWVMGSQAKSHVEKIHTEVDLMRLAKHPNIADLITSQGWGDGSSSIEIFMGLEEGNVDDLSNQEKFTLTSGLPRKCLKQMLSALDFLAYQDIVHRDVKPENILFSVSVEGPGYRFRLADFGVGKLAKYAYSCQGTNWFMAPEILKLRNSHDSDSKIQQRQSPKVDVWSLFVAIAYARDVCNYRKKDLDTNAQILDAAREASEEDWMSKYSAMVVEDPTHRASARDILNQRFDGDGIWKVNKVEMSEEDDGSVMDHQDAQATQHARLLHPVHPIHPARRSPRNVHRFRIEKKISPISYRTRLAQTRYTPATDGL